MDGLDALSNLSKKKNNPAEEFKKKNTGKSLSEFGEVKKKKEYEVWYVEKELSLFLKDIVSKLNTKNNAFIDKVLKDFIEERLEAISNLTNKNEQDILDLIK